MRKRRWNNQEYKEKDDQRAAIRNFEGEAELRRFFGLLAANVARRNRFACGFRDELNAKVGNGEERWR